MSGFAFLEARSGEAPGRPASEPCSDAEAVVCPISLEPIVNPIELRGGRFEVSSIVRVLLAAQPPSRPAMHPLHRTPFTAEEIEAVRSRALEDHESVRLLAQRGWSCATISCGNGNDRRGAAASQQQQPLQERQCGPEAARIGWLFMLLCFVLIVLGMTSTDK